MDTADATLAQGGKDYQSDFDSKSYVEQWWPGCNPDNPHHAFTVAVVTALHELLDSKNCKGKRLLDICSGPTIYSAMCGSRYFSEIYLTDYCEPNRKALQNWVSRDPTALDWSSFFKYAAYLEGNSATATDVENRLRACIKGVLACDLNDDLPLGSHQSSCSPADAILSCYTLEVVLTEDSQLADYFKKFCDMLVPGGLFCMVGVGYLTYYYVEGKRYPAKGMSEQLVRDSLSQAGFGEITHKLTGGEECHEGLNDGRDYFIASGIKLQ